MELIKKHQPTETKFVKQAEVKSEFKKIGSLQRTKGLTVFEFDIKNQVLKKAVFDECQIKIGSGSDKIISKLIVKPHTYYFEALNLKNAIKKVFKKTGILPTFIN
jgi:hypothetical protein